MFKDKLFNDKILNDKIFNDKILIWRWELQIKECIVSFKDIIAR